MKKSAVGYLTICAVSALGLAAVTPAFSAAPKEAKQQAKAAPAWIVTPEEAAQPPSRSLVVKQSDPDGPKISVRAPGEVKEVKAPVSIDVFFEPVTGHTVDMKSLKVTYVKVFDIDITDRLRPYITKTGIHSDNAPLPPGDHTIEVEVKDDAGKRTVEHFSFKVLK